MTRPEGRLVARLSTLLSDRNRSSESLGLLGRILDERHSTPILLGLTLVIILQKKIECLLPSAFLREKLVDDVVLRVLAEERGEISEDTGFDVIC